MIAKMPPNLNRMSNKRDGISENMDLFIQSGNETRLKGVFLFLLFCVHSSLVIEICMSMDNWSSSLSFLKIIWEQKPALKELNLEQKWHSNLKQVFNYQELKAPYRQKTSCGRLIRTINLRLIVHLRPSQNIGRLPSEITISSLFASPHLNL
jgi:hypothetical protein